MWYVLQVKTGQELNVVSALAEKQLLAYAPRENRLIRKGGGWSTKEYTLFPSYVFVNLNYTAETYYKVRGIPGVQKFLGADGLHPSTLSNLEAEWIKMLANGGAPLEPSLARQDPEEELQLMDGVLQNFITRIQEIDKHAHRAKVEITICGEVKTLPLSFKLLNEDQDTASE